MVSHYRDREFLEIIKSQKDSSAVNSAPRTHRTPSVYTEKVPVLMHFKPVKVFITFIEHVYLLYGNMTGHESIIIFIIYDIRMAVIPVPVNRIPDYLVYLFICKLIISTILALRQIKRMCKTYLFYR